MNIGGPEEFAKSIDEQRAKIAAFAKELGITADAGKLRRRSRAAAALFRQLSDTVCDADRHLPLTVALHPHARGAVGAAANCPA